MLALMTCLIVRTMATGTMFSVGSRAVSLMIRCFECLSSTFTQRTRVLGSRYWLR